MGRADKAWHRAKAIKKRPSDPTVLAGKYQASYSDGRKVVVDASSARNARRLLIKQTALEMQEGK